MLRAATSTGALMVALLAAVANGEALPFTATPRSSNPTMMMIRQSTCVDALDEQACQVNTSCYWCPVFRQGTKGSCHDVGPNGFAAPNGSFFCPYCEDAAKDVDKTCLDLNFDSCKYCYGNQRCMIATAQGCPSCGNAANSTQCEARDAGSNSNALPGCQWCALTAACYNPINYQSNCYCKTLPQVPCLQYPQQCSYCALTKQCQDADAPCDCRALTRKDCWKFDAACRFCEVTFACYNATGNYSCPASCKSLNDTAECNAARSCAYCPQLNQCLNQNGHPYCEACGSIGREDHCNEATICSWCSMTWTCLAPGDVCPSTCRAVPANSCGNGECTLCPSSVTCNSASEVCALCETYTTPSTCLYHSGCGWCELLNQCLPAPWNNQGCPTACGDIGSTSTCDGTTACMWCPSGSHGTGCYHNGYCATDRGLGIGGVAGIITGGVFIVMGVTTVVYLQRRRRRANAAAFAAENATTSTQATVAPLAHAAGASIVIGSAADYGSVSFSRALSHPAPTTAIAVA